MTNLEAKIAGLESRLHRLSVNGKENSGVRRRIEREIRNLQKKQNENQNTDTD
jgi:uncharacterized protein YigA (DUF484 family)